MLKDRVLPKFSFPELHFIYVMAFGIVVVVEFYIFWHV
jgi:hypothetical protein